LGQLRHHCQSVLVDLYHLLDQQILVVQLRQVRHLRQLDLLRHRYLLVLLRLVDQLRQVRHLRHRYLLGQQLLDHLWVLLRLVVRLRQVRHLRQLDQQLLEVQYLL